MELTSRNSRVVCFLIFLIVSQLIPTRAVSMNFTSNLGTDVYETSSVDDLWTDFPCGNFTTDYEKCRSARNRNIPNGTAGPVLTKNATIESTSVGPSVPVLARNYIAMKVSRALLIYYRPVISVVGIVGNILSLIVSLRKHNRTITTSWYIAALAVADLWVVLSSLMLWTMAIFFPHSRHPISCMVIALTTGAGRFSGTLLLIAIGYDRYKAISSPLQQPTWRNIEFTRYWIGLIFLIGLVYMSHFFAFDFEFTSDMACVFTPPNWLNQTVYSLCRSVTEVIIPFLLVFGCNMLLLRALKNRYKNFSTQCDDKEPYVISPDDPRTGTPKRKTRKTAGKTDTQLAVMLVTVSVAFLCLMLPVLTTRILVFTMEYRHEPGLFADMSLAIHLSILLNLTNSCINFFLYSLSGSKFRQDLKALFCKNSARASVP